MVLAVIVLLPVLVLSVWGFYKLSPGDGERRVVRLYNTAVVVAGVLFCTAVSLKFRTELADTPDRAWWPAFSMIFSLLALPLWLAVWGGARNLLLFRSGQRAGQDENLG